MCVRCFWVRFLNDSLIQPPLSKPVVDGGIDGGLGIEVCFAEETQIALGEGAKVPVPARRMAIADLPVFEYAVRSVITYMCVYVMYGL